MFSKYFSEHIFGLRLLIIWITKVSLPNTFVILCSILLMFYDCQLIFVVAVYWDVMLTNENFCLHYVNECIYRIMFHVWFCHRELGYIWDHTLDKCPVYMWERDVKTCIRCPGLNIIIIVLSTQITQCLAVVTFVYIFPPFKKSQINILAVHHTMKSFLQLIC